MTDRRARPRSGLDVRQVVNAALAFVDQHGAAALSMRKLGAELGVEAMTLYHYLPNKDALLDGLVEHTLALADPGPSPASETWPDMLCRFARSLRAALLLHPGVLPLMATRPALTPASMDVVERALAFLCEHGFSPLEALHVVNTIATFVVGHTLAEVGRTPGNEQSDPGLRMPQALDAERFPVLATALLAGGGQAHAERFEFALEALVGGIAARVR